MHSLEIDMYHYSRVADPGGVDPDPDPTIVKKPSTDLTDKEKPGPEPTDQISSLNCFLK